MNAFTPDSIFLLAAALFLTVVSFAIVAALFSERHRDRIVGFLLEGAAEDKGKPSLSRLQMLIWNVVVAFGFLYILANVGSAELVSVADQLGAIKPDADATAAEKVAAAKAAMEKMKATEATTELSLALSALLRPEILILLGVSNATYLLGKVAKPGAPPAGQDGDAEKIRKQVEAIPADGSPPAPAPAPAGPAPMG